MIHFSFAEYWWFYAAFTGFVLVLLALDIGVFHRTARKASLKESAAWSAAWVGLALAFGVFFYRYAAGQFGEVVGRELGLQYLSGYVVEKALSLDNIFVFVVVFSYFGIPASEQRRLLLLGIIGALLFRGIFIAAGAALLRFEWVMWVLGAFLIVTGFKMMFTAEGNIDPGQNPVVRLARRLGPVSPAMLALLTVEVSDVIFAIDSVPAIFGLTREPLVVFTSNVMAILGLRALYFLLAGAVERFHYLKYGLAAVLIFVGLKMVWLHEIPIVWSLGVICGVIGVSVTASLLSHDLKES